VGWEQIVLATPRRTTELRPEIEHRPVLDGVRGLAVLAVLLYHGGETWLSGCRRH